MAYPTQQAQTIITSILLEDTRRKIFPLLSKFGGQFTNQELLCGQELTVDVMGDVSDATITDCCPATGGGIDFCAGGDAPLVHKVPITVDKIVQNSIDLAKCDIEKGSVEHVDKYLGKLGDSLVAQVMNYLSAQITAANFAGAHIEQAADVDLDTLTTVNALLDDNLIGASDRHLILNTAAFNALRSDSRVSSNDGYGQRMACSSDYMLDCIEGWESVSRWHEMPDNGEDMIGFSLTQNAIRFASAVPNNSEMLARSLGIGFNQRIEYQTDASSGLTIMTVLGRKECDGSIYMWAGFLFGAKFGGSFGTAPNAIDLSQGLIRLTAS